MINQSFNEAILTVYDNPTSVSRLLQNGSTIIGQASIIRFDYISPGQLGAISAFSVLFTVFAWLGVIIIICAVMIGYGITI
jgi:hypothetical protein